MDTTTSSAVIESRRGMLFARRRPPGDRVVERRHRRWPGGRGRRAVAGAVLVLVLGGTARAETVLGPWVPLFRGVDHAVGTNTPGGGGYATLQVANAIRVDLTAPGIRLLATPPLDNPQPGFRETAGATVSGFLVKYGLQVAINVNAFEPTQYYLPAGTPMDVLGLLVSEGSVVSAQTSRDYAAAVVFTEANEASILPTNWPARDTTGVWTAVSGLYPILVDGVNVGLRYLGDRDSVHRAQPRTAFGLSQDRRWLYLLTIDGRQPGYSLGALDWEVADWMLRLGAHDAVNMDGGGSTTLVVADSLGSPVPLNASNAVADSGQERTLGAHFGVYALPAPGFINDIAVNPEETAAAIQWTTVESAAGWVEYGPTLDLGRTTEPSAEATTDHHARLTGLTRDTEYYFVVVAEVGGEVRRSATLRFRTTNEVTLEPVFGLSQPWRFTAEDLDGVAWMAPDYDDSKWSGPGPGLLWIDVRANGPNPEVQPRETPLPANPANNGYPYITYYFRTRFPMPRPVAGGTLQFSAFVDDGAVVYLNGREVYRLNMVEAPEPVRNEMLATGYSFAGDATAPVLFEVQDPDGQWLADGENVLAVEVHNYNRLSPDATFGMDLVYERPVVRAPRVAVGLTGTSIVLIWEGEGFTLQSAETVSGPWIDLPGPVRTSPQTLEVGGPARYFRLRQ